MAPSGPKRTRFWFCSALNSHWYFCKESDWLQNVARRSLIRRSWWCLLLTRLRDAAPTLPLGPDLRTQKLPLTAPRTYALHSSSSTSQRHFPAQGWGHRPASLSPGRGRPLLAQECGTFSTKPRVPLPSAGFPRFPNEAGSSGVYPGAQDWRTCTRPCVSESRSTSPAWKDLSLPRTPPSTLPTSHPRRFCFNERLATGSSGPSHEPALGPLADDLLFAPFPLLPVDSRGTQVTTAGPLGTVIKGQGWQGMGKLSANLTCLTNAISRHTGGTGRSGAHLATPHTRPPTPDLLCLVLLAWCS